MKSKCWLVPLLLWSMIFSECPATVVGDAGSDYLDFNEQQLEQIVSQSITNDNQKCELLATCSSPANCSHDDCAPLLGDKDDMKCVVVHNNKHCSLYGTSNTACTNMNVNYKRSYIRLAESTNVKSVDTALAICSQRALDPLMKEFASLNQSVLTRQYFAQIDGTFRALPGLARSPDECRNFEGRGRPWYRTATSVVKVVVVLIDLAATMDLPLPPNLGAGTILQAAKNIVTQLFITLSVGDYFNVIVFDSTRADPLSPSAVLVRDHNTTEQPELDPLKQNLRNQTVQRQNKQSNLTAAILAALPNFDSNPLAAKVILIFTDGVFATLGNVTLPSAELTGIKIFLYKLPQSNDADIFLSKNGLIQQLCDVGGHFEPILRNLENPLLALHKFFSYMANLKRNITKGRPHYSYIFQDFEGLGGNIITATKPAFSAAGDLIGAAGITIYIELLGNLTDQVNQAMQSRIAASGYNASAATQVVLTAANCSLVTETTFPCGETSNDPHAGLCVQTDMSSTVQDLACCGICSAPSSNNPKGKVVAGIVIGAIAGIVGLVIVGALAVKWKKKRDEIYKIPVFPGLDSAEG